MRDVTTWPGDAYENAAFDIGLATLELLTNEQAWVHRRVETIDLLRRELVRRQVTVEFTVPEHLRDELRVGAEGPWCVPIAILKKQPLRNFAVTLGLGITLGNLDGQTAESSSAVVLAGSALFAGIVAQRGEHKLVRDVFIGARLMLVLVALSALAAAASIAFGATCEVRGWIWGGGAVTSAGATTSLVVAWKNAKPLRRRQDPSDAGDRVITA